ncbi:hypothetical protein [Anaerobacillus alkaliphilus]|nr:hypothetical protein [Anaerobacillus alkaliphilus]
MVISLHKKLIFIVASILVIIYAIFYLNNTNPLGNRQPTVSRHL